MAKSKFNTKITVIDDYSQNFTAFKDKFRKELQKFMKDEAKTIENYMKTNAPWTDRTGEARRKLSATVDTNGYKKITMKLSHGVDYGIYLEMCNEQRFAIVGPTAQTRVPASLKKLSKFANKRCKIYTKKQKAKSKR